MTLATSEGLGYQPHAAVPTRQEDAGNSKVMLGLPNTKIVDNMRELLIDAIKKADAGHWDDAHMIVQQIDDPISNWLHANLHREEGDLDNAKYWYHRAIREYQEISIEEERAQILNLLTTE